MIINFTLGGRIDWPFLKGILLDLEANDLVQKLDELIKNKNSNIKGEV